MTVGRRPSRSITRTSSNASASASSSHDSQTTDASPAPSNGSTDAHHHHHHQHQHHHRNGHKQPPAGKPTTVNDDEDSDREPSYEQLQFEAPPPPKHISFPEAGEQYEFVLELVMFLYNAAASLGQFQHLYRTLWWLPHSNHVHPINFYLIDTHLVAFILILLGRRFAYVLVLLVFRFACPARLLTGALPAFRASFFGVVLLALSVCCVSLFQRHGYTVVYVCYPLVVYFVIFGLRLEPFLRMRFECDSVTYLYEAPMHCCSTNPHAVRSEIDALRSDYNDRMRQTIFTTVLNAYYASFVPCCFAQNFLYYDLWWATQHVAFTALGTLMMCASTSLSTNYCDVMHRAALHLGDWTRIESKKYVVPAPFWSKRIAWPGGVVVRYHGQLFRANGRSAMAVPGCPEHQRFFNIFQNPTSIYGLMCSFQLCVCFMQLIVLYYVIEWHNTVSVTFHLIGNYYTLFRFARDFGITHKVYAAEVATHDRMMTLMTQPPQQQRNNARHRHEAIADANADGGDLDDYGDEIEAEHH